MSNCTDTSQRKQELNETGSENEKDGIQADSIDKEGEVESWELCAASEHDKKVAFLSD